MRLVAIQRSTAKRGCNANACIGFLCTGGAGAYALGYEHELTVVSRQSSWFTARPNWSVEATANGGSRLLASSAVAAPSAAPHLKR
jgi:hypothetical protein